MSAPWIKSSRCPNLDDECIEVQLDRDDGVVRMRNSTKPDVVVECSITEWVAFTTGVQAGEMVI